MFGSHSPLSLPVPAEECSLDSGRQAQALRHQPKVHVLTRVLCWSAYLVSFVRRPIAQQTVLQVDGAF